MSGTAPTISNHPHDEKLTQFCPHCEYDPRGLTVHRCLECGQPFDRKALP